MKATKKVQKKESLKNKNAIIDVKVYDEDPFHQTGKLNDLILLTITLDCDMEQNNLILKNAFLVSLGRYHEGWQGENKKEMRIAFPIEKMPEALDLIRAFFELFIAEYFYIYMCLPITETVYEVNFWKDPAIYLIPFGYTEVGVEDYIKTFFSNLPKSHGSLKSNS
jgi:hypothetical protein